MLRMTLYSLAPAALLAAMTFTAPQQALADQPPFIIPKGQACPDFNVGLASTSGNQVTREFEDKNGNVVRVITAARGVVLTWTNYGLDPENPVAGASVTIRTDGSVMSVRTNPDGTQTVTATGHSALVLFPTDVPAGPTTTQYIGRIVYTIGPSPGFVFTLLSTSGSARDICAELAG